ncbi:MAG: hypothetical protein K6A65_02660 [Succinivibrionaceae bacterium]|nr:hypothetical protein [Succinivibrionaceae bacterium]
MGGALPIITTAGALGELSALVSALEPEEALSLDTEFERVRTYHPILALLQLSCRGHDYLVDPLAVDIAPLLEALLATRATVLLFSGGEDLDVLCHEAQLRLGRRDLPGRLLDVQLLMGFAGAPYGRGLAFAAEDALGITMEKSETRSDWMQRPLSAAQLSYAAEDTRHLERIFYHYLEKAGPVRLPFFHGLMEEWRAAALKVPDPAKAYLQIPGAGRLAQLPLTRLAFLAARRLGFAMGHDVAPNRVIQAAALCPAAISTPGSAKECAEVGMRWGALREFGEVILPWMGEMAGLEEDPALRRAYDFSSHDRQLKAGAADLRRRLAAACAELGLPQEPWCSRSVIHNYYWSLEYGEEPLLLRGFRRPVAERLGLC